MQKSTNPTLVILFCVATASSGCTKLSNIRSSVIDPTIGGVFGNNNVEVLSAEGLQTVDSDDGQYMLQGKIGAFTEDGQDTNNGDVEIVGVVKYE